jgi:hypothetical protein
MVLADQSFGKSSLDPIHIFPNNRSVPLMFIGSALIPVGLFWYGWSAQARIHWIMPNIGAAIFGAGAIICFQCMQTYIVDSYVRYAASGVAAAVVLRSLAGFGFPLFAPAMVRIRLHTL